MHKWILIPRADQHFQRRLLLDFAASHVQRITNHESRIADSHVYAKFTRSLRGLYAIQVQIMA
jgi:hypothetical protein